MKIGIAQVRSHLFAWAFLAFSPLFAGAQGKAPVPGLSLAWLPQTSRDSLVLVVKVALPQGWYINSHAPLDSFLVPTRLELSAEGSGLEFGAPRWPDPVVEHSQAMAGNMSLFKNSFEATVAVRAPLQGKKRGRLPKALPPVAVTLHYQSCDGTMCWPPKAVSARLAP